MQLENLLLADSAGFLEDERLSIFGGGIDRVEANRLPVAPQFAVIAQLRLLPTERLEGHHLTLEVTDPDGKRRRPDQDLPIKTIRSERDPAQPSLANIIVRLRLALTQPGNHVIHLLVDGAEVRSMPLFVGARAGSNAAKSQATTSAIMVIPSDRTNEDLEDPAGWDALEQNAIPSDRLKEIAAYLIESGKASA